MTDISRRRLLAAGAGVVGAGVGLGRGGILGTAAASPDGIILTNLVLLLDQAVYVASQLGSKVVPPSASPGGAVDPRTVVAGLVDLHTAHRDALLQALRGTGAADPTVDATYPSLLPAATGEAEVLATFAAIEDGLLGALYAAAAALSSRILRGAAASILGPTARVQALLFAAQQKPPVPASFVTGSAAAATAVTVPGSAAGTGVAPPSHAAANPGPSVGPSGSSAPASPAASPAP